MDALPTHARILNAAAEVFLQHGYGASSMEMVRQVAGVSNGSLYHHFPTKAKLADALYAHTLHDFHAALLPCLESGASAEAAVRGMLHAYVDWVLAHPGRARLLHDLRREGPLTDDGEWSRQRAQTFGALADWVTARTAEGQMREMPFPVWLALVFAPALSMTNHWVRQPSPKVSAAVRSALERAAWLAVSPDEGR